MNTENPIHIEQSEESVDGCNSLLRGEISAVETYQSAIDKFSTEPEVASLIRIQSQHETSVKELQEHVLDLQGMPETESGGWGAVTKAVQATANFFGESSALCSLKQGEGLGKAAFESALDDEATLPEVKRLIRGKLLPRVNDHISRLEDLIKSV